MWLEIEVGPGRRLVEIETVGPLEELAIEMKILTKGFGVARSRWREKLVEYTRLMIIAKT